MLLQLPLILWQQHLLRRLVQLPLGKPARDVGAPLAQRRFFGLRHLGRSVGPLYTYESVNLRYTYDTTG